MSIKTLIVGLGKIGMMYDFNKDNHYSSHSHSVNYHRKFSLCGGVDLSNKKRNKFHKKFNQIAYKNITEAYEKLSYDLIIGIIIAILIVILKIISDYYEY